MGLILGRKKRRSKIKTVSNAIPFIRFLGPGMTATVVLGAIALVVTGQIDLSKLDALRGTVGTGQQNSSVQIQPVSLQMDAKPSETIRIATFNIQKFGKTKTAKHEVMALLARIISQFDVVAIQEVVGGDATPVHELIDLLRASDARYSATISEPIGRSSQKESYAFLWDETRIQLIPQSDYLVHDEPDDRMSREPMVASFVTRINAPAGRKPFRFTLINVHTAPKEVVPSAINNEMDVLDDVYISVRNYDYQNTGEEDCIMLGDLNVNTAGLRQLGEIPGIQTIAKDTRTTTRRNKTYDHILIDQRMTREYTGRFGILDMQQEFGLTEKQALQVSDHQPLWAEFNAYESPAFDPVATAPQTIR